MQTELTRALRVTISDCDADGRWRPSAVLVQMQELAEVHSAELGLSRVHLVENGVIWVLYRQRIEMDSYPTFGDEILMTTWPGAIDGPLFPRYFTIAKKDGTPIGRAATSWILMDVKTRRPMRPSALPGKVPADLSREAPMPLPGMLRVTGAAPLASRKVCYSDLDVNAHMNNTRYIDWICDALDLQTLRRRGLASWQLNYIAEGRPGETLNLAQAAGGDTILIAGTRAADGRPVFEASVTFG